MFKCTEMLTVRANCTVIALLLIGDYEHFELLLGVGSCFSLTNLP